MTEPQELRSIDELFRNTFNNLTDTPADSGWDTPSDRVWEHVRNTVHTPRSGWSLQSLLLLSAFVAILAVGLYVVFSPEEKLIPVAPSSVEAPVQPPEAPTETQATTISGTTETGQVQQSSIIVKQKQQNTHQQQVAQQQTHVVTSQETLRKGGAAPLPGSNSGAVPNTTEARRAERAKQLELRWKTPLQLLPVPREKTPE